MSRSKWIIGLFVRQSDTSMSHKVTKLNLFLRQNQPITTTRRWDYKYSERTLFPYRIGYDADLAKVEVKEIITKDILTSMR